jgi:hypothetical protein
MEAILRRNGQLWFIGDVVIDLGQPYHLEQGCWLMITSNKRNQFGLEVCCYDIRKYACDISESSCVLVTAFGAADLPSCTETAVQLSQELLRSMPRREGYVALLRARRLPAIDGTKFVTSGLYCFAASDGYLAKVGRAHQRVYWECRGGTYLVRLFRRGDYVTVTLDVLVGAAHDSDHLRRCLHRLAS